METDLLILIILAGIIITIVIIVFTSMIWPSRISAFLKEACLLTIGKLSGNPKICESFRVE